MKQLSSSKPLRTSYYLIPDNLEVTTQLISADVCDAHDHDFYEIFYVLNGNMKHSMNGQETQILSIGDCIILTPNDTHCFSTLNDSIHRDLLISRSLFENVVSITLNGKKNISEILSSIPPIATFSISELIELENIAHNFTRNDDSDIKRGYGISLFVNIFLKFLQPIQKSNNSAISLSERILDCLNKNNHIQGGISSLAKELNYSQTYICQAFKKQTGTTLSQHIKNLRLNYISYYLKTTNYPLEKIANLVGIESLPYLNKIFKEKFNMPPIKYRKQFKTISDNV